jgi:hypothetical protein
LEAFPLWEVNGMSNTPTVYDPLQPPGKKLIFRPWRTDPLTGKRLWAKQYGLKAWPIWVDDV